MDKKHISQNTQLAINNDAKISLSYNDNPDVYTGDLCQVLQLQVPSAVRESEAEHRLQVLSRPPRVPEEPAASASD